MDAPEAPRRVLSAFMHHPFVGVAGREAWSQRVLAGRAGGVEEIAATVPFLLSEGATYIAGQSVVVDGGLTQSI